MINPQTRKIFWIATSFILAAVLFGLGGFLIYSYIQTIIVVQNKPDQSEIFWHLPVMFIGTALSAAGLYFAFVSIKSYAGNKKYFDILKTSVKSVFILGGIIVLVIILNI